MDITLKYENAVIELIEEYAQFWGNDGNINNHIIIDKERKRYQLVITGWRDESRFIHSVAFYIEILKDKIWIHQNNTEALIADELIAKGVKKTDIVLGFIAPSLRAYSGFALA
jgi:XisI protein